MSEIELDQVGSCADLRIDECYREPDLMGWPPVISPTQDIHEGSSVGSEDNFSSSQTKMPAKGREKRIAEQEKQRIRRIRRREQTSKKQEPAPIQHGGSTIGTNVHANHTPRLSGRTLYKIRRNLRTRKDGMVTHLCPDFDVENAIRNTPKAQPVGNRHPDFEIANEPTLKLVEGDLVTLSDKYVSVILSNWLVRPSIC